MGLTMLYAFEVVAAVASLVLNILKRECEHSRRHYKKSKNLHQIRCLLDVFLSIIIIVYILNVL